MTVEIEPRGQVSEEALADIERQLGHPLPADYRRWLAANNGGFIPDGAGLPSRPLYLVALTRAVDDDGSSSLVFETQSSEYLTSDFLRINKVDNSLLALKLAEPDRGSVWLLRNSAMGIEYDYEDEGFDSNEEYICAQKLERVADSFDDLLSQLISQED
ncbi:MAG: SMI1/KNR4 family protein [Micromonosporaceae bacterium]